MQPIQYKIDIKLDGRVPKVEQIVNSFKRDIETGTLLMNDCVPSINQFSRLNNVARDTVERAYAKLKHVGYLSSVPGRGFFVKHIKSQAIKILMVVNKLTPYRMETLEILAGSPGSDPEVDLRIHHGRPHRLAEILEDNMGSYHYYAILPKFNTNEDPERYLKIVKTISPEKLIILDKN